MKLFSKKSYLKLLPIIFLLLLWNQAAQATHIRAGEIIARRIGVFQYEFTVIMYTDTEPGNAVSEAISLNFGDGSPLANVPRTEETVIGDPEDYIAINIYRVTHTFPSAGSFVVSFVEEDRNAGVLNIGNGNSQVPFSVSTTVSIDPGIGLSSSPVLTYPPVDRACRGEKFFHNPLAFDPDGDSLSFEFIRPRQSASEDVPNYLNVADDSFDGIQENSSDVPATITIDPITGQIEWNAPGKAGEYNLAFVVREWRDGIIIGAVVRDMQIIVSDCKNKRPSIMVPPEICATANEDANDPSNIIDVSITATEPDNNNLVISSTDNSPVLNRGVYDPTNFNEPAQFIFSPSPQASPASAKFLWETGCEHVREEPYIIGFRVEDDPLNSLDPSLIDLKPMLVTVKGPPPTGLAVALDSENRTADLTWNSYLNECPSCVDKIDALEIIIWRRQGCVDTIFCEQSPDMLGYEEIGRLPATETTFRDQGPLSPGLNYSYIISINFPAPGNGVSRASDEQCVFLPIDVPLITKVSVESTSSTQGEIDIDWLRPFPNEEDLSTRFTPPFRYELYRASGLNGSDFTLVDTQMDNIGTQVSFSFTDTNLDTENTPYLYKIEWYNNAGTATESKNSPSAPASSVRLTALGGENQIELNWTYNVSWSNNTNINQGVYRHLIYRRTANIPNFSLIDSVEVGVPTYVDQGIFDKQCLNPDSTYFYYVLTRGSYFNDNVPIQVLENKSQVDFASPSDRTPPNPPVLALEANDCSSLEDKACRDSPTIKTSNQNTVFWTSEQTLSTCDDIAYYKLFYRGIGQAEFDFNNSVYQGADTFFVHTDLPILPSGSVSTAGCYAVIAVDQVGNESVMSNEVCQDNCLYYELPNIITPNGDGVNDLFRACPKPLFVEAVQIEIFNRWGNKVYESDDDIEINWNAINQKGSEVPSGVYFYEVTVRFFSIHEDLATQKFKGWVEVVRSKHVIGEG